MPDQQLQWVATKDGIMPPGAIQGGSETDGRPLFIARAFYKGGLHPGKSAPHLRNGGFAMGWGGKEHNLNEFFVLCGNANSVKWVPCSGGADERKSGCRFVEAGHEDNGNKLYVSKTVVGTSIQLGKAGQHLSGGMSYGFGGGERGSKDYWVLAYK